jgi:hypothetical protein
MPRATPWRTLSMIVIVCLIIFLLAQAIRRQEEPFAVPADTLLKIATSKPAYS